AGVTVRTAASYDGADVASASVIIQCTGGQRGTVEYDVHVEHLTGGSDGGADPGRLVDIGALRLGQATLPADGDVVLIDPIGGPIAVALAEELGGRAILVTQDQIAGNELSRSGDLAPANTRLAQAGV